jgi:hypothetical protein
MLAAKRITNARPDQVRGLQCAVLASIRHRRGKGIQTVGGGSPAHWKLKEAAN